MNKFALIGAAGYIAPRHMKAIKDTGGELIAAFDIADSVGILDSYFPSCEFFTDEYAFYDFLLDRQKADYIVICSPNHLHAEHCRNALKIGADIICEKPLVLTLAELEELKELEALTGKSINTILQLRLHPMLSELKKAIDEKPDEGIHQVSIEYFTPRGKWYHASWKGDVHRSGGIATNIGIHLFDLVSWLFGEVKNLHVEKDTDTECAGTLRLERAEVRWTLSIAQDALPKRQMLIDGKVYEFTEGFADLHTRSYEKILNKEGFTTDEVKPSIAIVERIRNR